MVKPRYILHFIGGDNESWGCCMIHDGHNKLKHEYLIGYTSKIIVGGIYYGG